MWIGKKCKLYYGASTTLATAWANKFYIQDIIFTIPKTTKTSDQIYTALAGKIVFNANGSLNSAGTAAILAELPEFFDNAFIEWGAASTVTAVQAAQSHLTNRNHFPYDGANGYYFIDSGNTTYFGFRNSTGYFLHNDGIAISNSDANNTGSLDYVSYNTYLAVKGLIKTSNGVQTYSLGFNSSQTALSINSANKNADTFFDGFKDNYVPPSDPYSEGGTSTSGGGHGDFDTITDSMSEPSYDPVESYNRGYANHGFAKVYLPTSAQLLSLHNYLWSSSLDNTLKKMYSSPIDCIISLNMIPLDLSELMGDPPTQGNIIIGNVDTEIENVNIPYTQFIMLDCGTISISEFFGSYLDYSPYTKLSIYLPYIGMKELDIDDFMNGEIGVKYYIDIVSGDCVAYINQVNLSSNDVRPAIAGGAGVLYQFTGNVAFNVPISAQNFSQIYAASAGAMIGGAGMLASALSGGMSAPMALTGIAATGVNVATSKPTISRGGSIPSTSGYLGIQVPYLILTRPRQCLPEDQNALVGYPAYITVTIEDIEGYNEFEIVHLENIPATDTEKAEIEKLLKSGVIL